MLNNSHSAGRPPDASPHVGQDVLELGLRVGPTPSVVARPEPHVRAASVRVKAKGEDASTLVLAHDHLTLGRPPHQEHPCGVSQQTSSECLEWRCREAAAGARRSPLDCGELAEYEWLAEISVPAARGAGSARRLRPRGRSRGAAVVLPRAE